MDSEGHDIDGLPPDELGAIDQAEGTVPVGEVDDFADGEDLAGHVAGRGHRYQTRAPTAQLFFESLQVEGIGTTTGHRGPFDPALLK